MYSQHDQAHRLGKRELGPHAYEDRMPDRIVQMLQTDGQTNLVRNIIPKLEQLLTSSSGISVACLCNANTVFVHKLAREGNTFCGYRNIQMLLEALGLSSARQFRNVLDVQDMIEHAWDAGYNPHGRKQTGGIRQTRKHIGTPEAEALLQSLGIACTGTVYAQADACKALYDFVEEYYGIRSSTGVQITDKMPIFLQRPKHSILIVGIARLVDESRSLIVLDPAVPPSLDAKGQWRSPVLKRLLKRVEMATYCRSEKLMSKFAAFETLSID